jgi:diguanylate cyclase (GGDEF)-like protein/PAS domain S-box-containing protein
MAEVSLLIYAPADELARLEARCRAAGDQPSAELLLRMAWHVRQSDGRRAVALCEQALPLLEAGDGGSVVVALVLGERALLVGDLASALQHCGAARAELDAGGASLTLGHCLWFQASIAQEQGDHARFQQLLGQAREVYRGVDSQVGRDCARAARARQLSNLAFRDPQAAAQALQDEFGPGGALVPGVQAWVDAAAATVASLSNHPVDAIKLDLSALQYAAQSGQMRQFVICAANASEGFVALGDLDAALEWCERGMAQARDSDWPLLVAACQRLAGEVLRLLGRPGDARGQLSEAARTMATAGMSRNKAEVLASLAQLDLEEGRFNQALAALVALEPAVAPMGEADLLLKAWRGQAVALNHLGDATGAQCQAEAALALAREKNLVEEQIRVLQVLAEIARTMDAGAGVVSGRRLDALNDALRLAEARDDAPVPVDLLQQLATACAEVQDFAQAYRHSQAAEAARRRQRLTEADNRSKAISIRQEVSLAHADTERHKRLAANLQATADTLERLGLMGREITASLDAGQVGQTLLRHAGELLDVRTCFIYTLSTNGDELVCLAIDNSGDALPAAHLPLAHETSLIARCARQRQELVIERETAAASKTHLPGTVPSLSLLFFPLEVGGRLLGVMSVQSIHARAYGERERAIFRSLCAWAAIGLDNAAAYQALARQESELRVAAAAFESQLAMLITDARASILRVNQAGQRLTGYAVAELLGQHPRMLLPLRVRAETEARWFSSVAADQSWEGECPILDREGREVPALVSVAAVRSSDGTVSHIIYTATDITERKRAEDEIRQLAFFDPLTRLPNRRLLLDRMGHALVTGARSGLSGAILFLDLDKFKTLNDTRGHAVGDQLLACVGERLRQSVRECDTVARLGGDEFVILLEGLEADPVGAADQVGHITAKIQLALNQAYLLDGEEHHSSPSMGVAMFRGQDAGADELLRQADLAMYQAKAAGRNTVRFFDPGMQAAVTAHARLEADLRLALTLNQFELHHQTQVDAAGQVTGTEALLRWRHPARGMVSPADFIPMAEESGLILPLGQWVLATAVETLQRWALQPALAGLTIAVNISARQFHSPQFVPEVLALLDRPGLDPQRLKLELTESLLLENVDAVIAKMHALKARGVSFSLDDFGTGYSSLAYLKRLPLQQLKIDQSFVRDIFEDENDVAIVRAIVTLGQSLGLQVIAEGVETVGQHQFLAGIGCEAFQGYLFARPQPVQSVEQRLLAGT